ncbi:MAG TPA: AI-2E family transporter, partial [Stellaceae bacterium]|nr:AI-2E family transporter [Stellaceae bacterium]
HDLHRTTQMLNDAVERLSRYLWSEFVVNAVYGFLMGFGTFFIGVPNAALWGAMFLVLRFVPYIGTWIAAFFPLVLSLTIAAGWSAFFETLGLFITVELLTSQAIEPMVFAGSAGMSPVAVLVAATFWTWLWGPIGLVLSTPLTACLVVIGRYAPPLRFFSILLGNEAPLAAEESFYQRLLAGDSAEATEQLETFLKTGSLTAFCDQVAIPALLLGQDDSERGVLTRGNRAEIADTLRDMIDNVVEDEHKDKAESEAGVECVGARTELDDAAALLLTHLLAERGVAARTVPARHWLTEPRPAAVPSSESKPPAITCVSHLGNASATRLRLLARRLRRRSAARATLVLGLWGAPASVEAERELPVDETVNSLTEAVERICRVTATSTTRCTPQSAAQA